MTLTCEDCGAPIVLPIQIRRPPRWDPQGRRIVYYGPMKSIVHHCPGSPSPQEIHP